MLGEGRQLGEVGALPGEGRPDLAGVLGGAGVLQQEGVHDAVAEAARGGPRFLGA